VNTLITVIGVDTTEQDELDWTWDLNPTIEIEVNQNLINKSNPTLTSEVEIET
jgi:hypothetical protein